MSNEWMKNVVVASGREFGERADIGFDLLGPVKSVGKAVGRTFKRATRTATKAMEQIPIVGKPLAATTKLGTGIIGINVEIVARVADGERIDKAAYNTYKDRIKQVKTAAPYAAAVIGGVGVGSGAEGPIAAGNAASKGIPIGPDVVNATRRELASPEAISAFDQTYNALVNSAPVGNPKIEQAVALSKTVISGKAGGSGLDGILSGLSSEQQKGVKVGIALGTGKTLQQTTRTAVSSDSFLERLMGIGRGETEKDPVTKLAAVELRHKPDVQKGFLKGLGFLAHKTNPTALDATRAALTPEERKGFDIAGSVRIGQLSKPISTSVPPAERLGYYLAEGTKGMKPENRKTILQSVKGPAMLKGVRKGLKEDKQNIFEKLIGWILGKDEFRKAA